MIALLGLAFAQDGALEQAYQKEFAFLHGEKRALESRLAQLHRESETKIAAGEADLESLQARLIALQTRGDAAQDLLEDVERQGTSVAEDADLLDTMLYQARVALERPGYALDATPPDAASRAALVETAVAEGLVRVDEGRSLRVAPGDYFLQDGSKQAGDVLYVGNVAAYAVGAGALAPVGEGRLQLRRPGAVDPTGEGTVGVFLFESLDKRIDEEQVKTLGTVMRAGGAVGWVIVVLGLVGLVLAAVRAGLLLTARPTDDALLRRIENALVGGDREAALILAKRARGGAARVAASLLGHPGGSRQSLEDAASRAMLEELPRIDRFGTLILVIAAVAPLLGLLGTVTGMIKTFEIITEFGTGDPKMLSGGISEALVTTQFGLMVAIPLLLLGNLLSSRAELVSGGLERTALKLLTLLDTPPDESGAVRRVEEPAPPRVSGRPGVSPSQGIASA